MKEFQVELLAWRDGLVKDECLYRLHSAGVAIRSHYYSLIRQPVENVLAVGEPSVVYISNDDDGVIDLYPKSCGCIVPSRHINVLEAFYAGDSFSSWIVDSGTTNHVCTSLQLFDS